jgi:hypothetical protein
MFNSTMLEDDYDDDQDSELLQITEQMHTAMQVFSDLGIDRVHVGGLLRIMGVPNEEAAIYDETWASLKQDEEQGLIMSPHHDTQQEDDQWGSLNRLSPKNKTLH